MKLVIVTPSYINSEIRLQYAKDSFLSLEKFLGSRYEHVVVHDLPQSYCSKGARINSSTDWLEKTRNLYKRENLRLISRRGKGSAPATLIGVREARKIGADLIFLHLDDNIYLPLLSELLQSSQKVFSADKEMMQIRLTGYPIIWKENSLKLGNASKLQISKNTISFDNVELTAERQESFTVWSSYFNKSYAQGIFHPIILWTTVYRADFLEKVLSNFTLMPSSLGEIEAFYKLERGWYRAKGWVPWPKRYSKIPGKFAFLNMQFCGLEMHRNKNWKELLQMSNQPIR